MRFDLAHVRVASAITLRTSLAGFAFLALWTGKQCAGFHSDKPCFHWRQAFLNQRLD